MKLMLKLMAISLQLLAIACSAQSSVLPKTEYQLVTSASTITVERNKQDSVQIALVRSRSFKNGTEAMTVNSSVPGLNLTMRKSNQPDNYIMRIVTTDEAPPGEYNILPTCTLRNKTKGTVIKLIIK